MVTISIVQLWNQIQTTAKTATSGYQSDSDFNNDIDAVQKRIANILCDNYENNQKIEDALIGFIVSSTNSASSTGIISFPANYFRLISSWVNVAGKPYPANKIATNQIASYASSYVRNGNASTNDYYISYLDGGIQLWPEVQASVTIAFCRVPPTAMIALTPNSTANSDYVVPTAVVDLIWSPVVYNLFYYMMLEMLGIEQRENILYEYAQLGIPKEAYIGMAKVQQ